MAWPRHSIEALLEGGTPPEDALVRLQDRSWLAHTVKFAWSLVINVAFLVLALILHFLGRRTWCLAAPFLKP